MVHFLVYSQTKSNLVGQISVLLFLITVNSWPISNTYFKLCHTSCLCTQVGTGFSFTDSEEGYSSNQDQIADNLYEYVTNCYYGDFIVYWLRCLHQFFLMFDDLQKHDFYIIGEVAILCVIGS